MWRLPQQLVSQSNLIERLRNNRKKLIDWKNEDVLKWLSEINMATLESRASIIHLNGRHLLTVPGEIIAARLHVYEDQQVIFTTTRKCCYNSHIFFMVISDARGIQETIVLAKTRRCTSMGKS